MQREKEPVPGAPHLRTLQRQHEGLTAGAGLPVPTAKHARRGFEGASERRHDHHLGVHKGGVAAQLRPQCPGLARAGDGWWGVGMLRGLPGLDQCLRRCHELPMAGEARQHAGPAHPQPCAHLGPALVCEVGVFIRPAAVQIGVGLPRHVVEALAVPNKVHDLGIRGGMGMHGMSEVLDGVCGVVLPARHGFPPGFGLALWGRTLVDASGAAARSRMAGDPARGPCPRGIRDSL